VIRWLSQFDANYENRRDEWQESHGCPRGGMGPYDKQGDGDVDSGPDEFENSGDSEDIAEKEKVTDDESDHKPKPRSMRSEPEGTQKACGKDKGVKNRATKARLETRVRHCR